MSRLRTPWAVTRWFQSAPAMPSVTPAKPVSATVSIHVVTSASFSPSDVSTGDTVTVSAMGTAGLTATYNVFDAEGTNIRY